MVENSSLKESGGKSKMNHLFICMMTPGSRNHPLCLPPSFQLLIGPFQAFTFFFLQWIHLDNPPLFRIIHAKLNFSNHANFSPSYECS
ncbi:hypothetical protein LINPERHAP1_LOCUS8682 [Linum perenne]